jgi:hypothetical protein
MPYQAAQGCAGKQVFIGKLFRLSVLGRGNQAARNFKIEIFPFQPGPANGTQKPRWPQCLFAIRLHRWSHDSELVP